MGVSSCRLALVRAHYILGEVKEGDALLKAASGSMLFYSHAVRNVEEKKLEVREKKK